MRLILIGVTIYLIWTVIYISWAYFKSGKTPTASPSSRTRFSDNIMGQTKSVICQTPPSEAIKSHDENAVKENVTFAPQTDNKYSQIVSSDELEDVFTDNKMDIDIDIENPENEFEPEVPCFIEDSLDINSAGVDYDELNNLTKVIGSEETNSNKVIEAARTALNIEHTELLDAVITGYENGLQKVTAMLAKYETLQQADSPKMEQFEEFELNNFL